MSDTRKIVADVLAEHGFDVSGDESALAQARRNLPCGKCRVVGKYGLEESASAFLLICESCGEVNTIRKSDLAEVERKWRQVAEEAQLLADLKTLHANNGEWPSSGGDGKPEVVSLSDAVCRRMGGDVTEMVVAGADERDEARRKRTEALGKKLDEISDKVTAACDVRRAERERGIPKFIIR